MRGPGAGAGPPEGPEVNEIVTPNDWLETDTDEQLQQRITDLDALPCTLDALETSNRHTLRAAILNAQAVRMLRRWKETRPE